MSSGIKVHALSDLHLLHPGEPFYQKILNWLSTVPQPGDHVALAGDIFDVYVGNKSVFRKLHSPFFEAIRGLSQRGVFVHHVEGNHDFWLRGAYLDSGCADVRVHGDSIEIELSGRTLRVEHGDLADPTDRIYLLLRKFFRSGLALAMIGGTPGVLLDWMGRTWSNGSRDRQGELPESWSEERRNQLRQIYFEYSRSRVGPGRADSLIMGHCHDAHDCPGYMNVGFPRRHQAWVRWTPESNTLERIPFAKDS